MKKAIKYLKKAALILGLLFTFSLLQAQQLVVKNTYPYNSPDYLVKYIFLSGSLPVRNIRYVGADDRLNNPYQLGYFSAPNTGLGIDEGLILTNSPIQFAVSNGDPSSIHTGIGGWTTSADQDVKTIVGSNQTCDVAYLHFDFLAVTDSVEFQYVFGSTEYPGSVCSSANDAFGFFITGLGINGPFLANGQNMALVPGTNMNVSINTVNNGMPFPHPASGCPPGGLNNAQYYVGNSPATYVDYPGYTTVLTAKANVICGEWYHLKLAIADGVNCGNSSGVFLKAGSFLPWAFDYSLSQFNPNKKYIEGCETRRIYFKRTKTDTAAVLNYAISGNAINGVDYAYLNGQVNFAIGKDTASVLFRPFADGITEGVDTAIFSVVNVSTCGDSITSDMKLLIKDEFAIAVTVSSDSINCPGDTAHLTATGAGNRAFTYLWDNGTTAQTGTYTPLFSDTYTVTLTDTRGCKGLGHGYVGVRRFYTNAGTDTLVCIGDTVTIGGNPSGPPNAMYLWQYDTALIGNYTGSQQLAVINGSYTFYVAITDSTNCTITDSVFVDILPLPTIQPNGDTLWLCPGASIQLVASGAQVYSWSPGIWLSDSTISNPLANPPNTITYFINGIDSNTCENTSQVTVLVNGTVPTNAGIDTAICYGDSVIIGGLPTSPLGSSYQWLNWAINNPTVSNPNVSPPTDTTYWVVSQNDTCFGIDSVFVKVLPLPLVQTSSDTGICNGDTFNISVTGALTYQWLGDTNSIQNPYQNSTKAYPSVSGIYTVIGTDSNGCSNSDSLIYTVFSIPIIDAGIDTTVCENTPYLFASSPNTVGYDYVWTPSFQLSDSSVSQPVFMGLKDVTYVLNITDTNNCKNQDTVIINVFRLLPVSDTSICLNDTLTIMYKVENGVADYYTLFNTDTFSVSPQPTFYFDSLQTSKFHVLAISQNGCESVQEFQISSLPLPIDTFSFDAEIYCEGMQVVLSYTDSVPFSLLWDIDGNSYSDNPLNIWVNETQLTGSLIVENTYNCKAIIPLFGSVDNSGLVFASSLPNIFTPNNDGVNDYFEINLPVGLFGCSSLKVFNRWGVIVYDSQEYAISWNGKLPSGQDAQTGVYFYVLEVNGIVSKGNVQLLR
ncbi:MAG: gliding motility-associated-like protein [Salibacteraceae bacterium]